MSGKYDIDRDLTIRRLKAEIAELKESYALLKETIVKLDNLMPQAASVASQEPWATEDEPAPLEGFHPLE